MAPSDPPHGYAICGGKEGKERLDLLARVLLPTTMQLLNRAGLIRGMKCLDVGCGGGHVAISMARVLGPEGCVIGTDTDAEILAFARDDAEAAKVTTVKFRQVDGCACVWHEQFDVAYARFLFSHLNQPEKCLAARCKRAPAEELSSSRTRILRGVFVIQSVRPISGTTSCIKYWYNGGVAIQI
ncbi:MAG TPA: class I SAM-dependent methyltransferase [Candidatus Udaeobacter sp.]|jgi:SAM-dependent methyltransferase